MAAIRTSVDDTYKWQAFVDIENLKKLEQMNVWLTKTFGDKNWRWRLMSSTNEFCPMFLTKEDAVLFFMAWK